MGKKGAKIKEGRTREGRKEMRKNLGTLRSLTVQPKTKLRYQEGLRHFFDYLQSEELQLPSKRDAMDALVSDYLEHIWAAGEGRSLASNVLAGLQDQDPKLKGCLPGSWRLMKTWTTNEIPCRAPPLTEPVLKAMVGWAIFNQEFAFGLSLLVGFHALLRSGELLALQNWQIHMVSPGKPAVLNLGLTKSGKRQGAAESVTLTDKAVLEWLWKWKLQASKHQFLTAKPHIWRQMFARCLLELKLDQRGFRPYSLRRGGATSLFVKLGSLDRVLLQGRWTALKTAKIYLNSGLAMIAELEISPKLLRPFHSVFENYLRTLPTLEPALFKEQGRGTWKADKSGKSWGLVVVFPFCPKIFGT